MGPTPLDQFWPARRDRAYSSASSPMRDAMKSRYCFGTTNIVTLAEAGRQAKRSGERMRQLETVWKDYCATLILGQQDDEFIKAITKLLPKRDGEISRELIRQGWLKDTWG